MVGAQQRGTGQSSYLVSALRVGVGGQVYRGRHPHAQLAQEIPCELIAVLHIHTYIFTMRRNHTQPMP